MSVHVRAAAAADREALLALVPRLRAFGAVPLRPPAALDRAERAALAAALDAPRPDAALLVAATAEAPVAGVALVQTAADYFTGEAHGHLAILVVAEAAEGRGAGRALLAAAEAWSAARGHRFLTLNVFAGNGRARAVYERAGFAPDTLRYYKELPPPAG
jgi:GNAT superfamily N-acetyltransferase